MTVSKAQICNLALSHIGQTTTTIANLDTDTNIAAVQCRLNYDVARRFVLADAPWRFARRRVAGADIGSPPTLWLYRYEFPVDCISIQEIERTTDAESPIPYDVELTGDGSARSVVTNKADAVLVYTRDTDSLALFSPGFVNAFSWYLASQIAYPITTKLDTEQRALRMYEGVITTAKAREAAGVQARPEPDAPWVRAR